MDLTTYASLVLVVMVAAYAVAKILKLSTEISMFIAALAGCVVGGFGISARHIAEGAMTYLDINLIFITATLFMNILTAMIKCRRLPKPFRKAPALI